MEHTAKTIEFKQLSDGALAVRVRCCDDETTDSWHTVYDIGAMTEEQLDAWEASCLESKQAHHASVEKALKFLARKMKAT